MEVVSKQPQQKIKRRDARLQTIYSRCLITRNIVLPITAIGKNIRETIEENVKASFEGKCVVEGYIKQNSSKIVTYSSGLITKGNLISFEVVFECDICFPVEGMLISCVAKNITKAGIRAESATEVPSPIVVFVTKDHHYNLAYFSEVQEGDKINVRVIGQRFELNDKYISIIGELVKEKEPFVLKSKQASKPRIVIED
jgi:DNA-directed RNA polymerase subunit E'/Rpb7